MNEARPELDTENPEVHVRIVTDNLTLLNRTYPAGSVVRIPHNRASSLVNDGHATLHQGPEYEPDPVIEVDPATGEPTQLIVTPRQSRKGNGR